MLWGREKGGGEGRGEGEGGLDDHTSHFCFVEGHLVWLFRIVIVVCACLCGCVYVCMYFGVWISQNVFLPKYNGCRLFVCTCRPMYLFVRVFLCAW